MTLLLLFPHGPPPSSIVDRPEAGGVGRPDDGQGDYSADPLPRPDTGIVDQTRDMVTRP